MKYYYYLCPAKRKKDMKKFLFILVALLLTITVGESMAQDSLATLSVEEMVGEEDMAALQEMADGDMSSTSS